MTDRVVVVIPSYCPGAALPCLVRQLSAGVYRAIVIVDDGSGPEYRSVFEEVSHIPGVRLLRHAVNLGKGAALKTAFNSVLCEDSEAVGAVTADADGQHSAQDIRRVAQRLQAGARALVMGVRQFDADHVPLRSRIGNQLTVFAVRLLIGQHLADTQTGLRGIPAEYLPDLLRIPSTGYEFELDMLVSCRHHSWPVEQVPIATIYEDGNRSSHFNPLLDSVRIYFVLLRFSFVSLLTAVLDNLVFMLALPLLGSIGGAQIVSRLAAVTFNYGTARKAVFLSREKHHFTFPRYLLLVVVSGTVSWGLIQLLLEYTPLTTVGAKVTAEALLFIANFAIQRDFVFRKREAAPAATDWDRYYREVPFTARLTRRYTQQVLVHVLRRFAALPGGESVLVELGGANSCFVDRIVREFRPAEYHVIDTNRHGLELLRRREPADGTRLLLHEENCLGPDLALGADLAFSVGLVEHFNPSDTRRAIQTHFDLLKPGGWALISFPTPTWLYRAARGLVTALGMWRFHDERPMQPDEALATIASNGRVLFRTTLWPLVFTQHVILAQKHTGSQA